MYIFKAGNIALHVASEIINAASPVSISIGRLVPFTSRVNLNGVEKSSTPSNSIPPHWSHGLNIAAT